LFEWFLNFWIIKISFSQIFLNHLISINKCSSWFHNFVLWVLNYLIMSIIFFKPFFVDLVEVVTHLVLKNRICDNIFCSLCYVFHPILNSIFSIDGALLHFIGIWNDNDQSRENQSSRGLSSSLFCEVRLKFLQTEHKIVCHKYIWQQISRLQDRWIAS